MVNSPPHPGHEGGGIAPGAEQGRTSASRKRRRDDTYYAVTPEDDTWLFTDEEVEETPSRLQGLTAEAEKLVIAKSCRYIMDMSNALGIPNLTMGVACTMFQRFFMLESLLVHKPAQVAAAAFFLACKASETHRRLRDVITIAVKTRTRGTEEYPDGCDIDEGTPAYYDEKQQLLDRERELLRVMNFDLTVEHPYRFLWDLQRLFLNKDPRSVAIIQAAWNFTNDSYETNICVRFDPSEIACAAFFLANQLHDNKLPDGKKRNSRGDRIKAWHEVFKPNLHNVRIICNTMMDVYEIKSKEAKNNLGDKDKINESFERDNTDPNPVKKLKTSPADSVNTD